VNEQLREEVRQHYAAAARTSGCGEGREFYDEELPEGVMSFGCGHPTAVAELREGETVLDLGSGGGLDVILSAKRVGPTGIAWGLDMTEEMLAVARENAKKQGVTNAHFLKGHIEEIPLPAESVDVVISNCVINLSTDKPAVFSELARVLKPGGRVGVADVVAEDRLTPEQRAERGSYVGCVAGALSKSEYEQALAEAGFEDVSVEFLPQGGDGIYGAHIKATKPVTAARPQAEPLALAGASAGCGCGSGADSACC
jgi:ubiquinone/menaquinone biosynthesis C-methylase UbiE